MKKRIKKLVTIGMAVCMCAGIITGCGSSSNSGTDSNTNSGTFSAASTEAVSGEVETIDIAVANGQAPYTYTDENGEITGLDVDILKAVDDLLPEYDFNIAIVDWDTMCAGVQSGKYSMGSCCLLHTPAREEIYLLSDNIYYYLMNLVVAKDSDINSLEDMDGKELTPFPDSDGLTYVLQCWEDEHPDIHITRESASEAVPYADAFAGVQSGRWDAWFGDGSSYDAVAEQNPNLDLKVTDYVAAHPACFIINTDCGDLKEKVDTALASLKDDGTLDDLSTKWLGKDVWEIGDALLNGTYKGEESVSTDTGTE